MGARRKARECGLQVLYQLETAGRELPAPGRLPPPVRESPLARVGDEEVEEALTAFFENFDAPDRTHAYTEELVHGVVKNLTRIDEVIGRHSPRWRVERMAIVDRNVLRLGVYELMSAPDVPAKVILDEGVEIARRFGSEQSSAFVNGVLDSAARELRPGDVKERGA